MLLWFIFAILLICVLGVLLWPLIKENTETASRASFDVAVYQDQLKELDKDIERGVIAKQEGENARLEITRRLLASADKEEKQSAAKADSNNSGQVLMARIASVALIVLTAAVLYPTYGSPTLLEASNREPENVTRVKQLVAQVEARLKENPNSGRGWEVLAPVYMKLGRFRDAAIAYAQTIKLLGESPERWSNFGEALVRQNDNVLTEEAKKAFQRALKMQPDMLLPAVRLIMGLEQEGKNAEALTAWKTLLPKVKQNPALTQMARMRISALSGSSPEQLTKTDKTTDKTTVKSDEPGPTAEQVEDARKMSPRDRMAMIQNMVKGLAQRLSEDGGSVAEWMRLIRSYKVLGRKELAQKALEDARENLKDNAKALTELNEFARKIGLTS